MTFSLGVRPGSAVMTGSRRGWEPPQNFAAAADSLAAVRRYTVIDLFAGCGGMTLGFTATGRFEPVMAVEFEPDAADTYELNFGHHVARQDNGHPHAIEEVDVFPRADVVI